MQKILRSLLIIGIFLLTSAIYAGPNRYFSDQDLQGVQRVQWQDWSKKIQPGDIILVPLNCWSCFYIEDETGAPFSHSAVVMEVSEKEVLLAEALLPVARVKLRNWISKLRSDSPWVVVRPEFKNDFPENLELREKFLAQRFEDSFKGLSFDSDFLWDSFDEKGEKLYCSEFIFKFLQPYLTYPLETFPMNFTRNWEFWENYFNVPVPHGFPGFSPYDFLRSEGMHIVFWN